MKKIIFLFSLAIILHSCSSVEILIDGCTDPYAINYNPNADNDDLSCRYEADVVFYGDVSAALYFNNLGIDWLDVYVGNSYVATLSATTGFTYVPDCYPDTEPEAAHFTLEWGDTQETTFVWTVRDGTGTIHASGTDLILATECLPMEISISLIKEYQEATK